jgi:hypothetical protein
MGDSEDDEDDEDDKLSEWSRQKKEFEKMEKEQKKKEKQRKDVEKKYEEAERWRINEIMKERAMMEEAYEKAFKEMQLRKGETQLMAKEDLRTQGKEREAHMAKEERRRIQSMAEKERQKERKLMGMEDTWRMAMKERKLMGMEDTLRMAVDPEQAFFRQKIREQEVEIRVQVRQEYAEEEERQKMAKEDTWRMVVEVTNADSLAVDIEDLFEFLHTAPPSPSVVINRCCCTFFKSFLFLSFFIIYSVTSPVWIWIHFRRTLRRP